MHWRRSWTGDQACAFDINLNRLRSKRPVVLRWSSNDRNMHFGLTSLRFYGAFVFLLLSIDPNNNRLIQTPCILELHRNSIVQLTENWSTTRWWSVTLFAQRGICGDDLQSPVVHLFLRKVSSLATITLLRSFNCSSRSWRSPDDHNRRRNKLLLQAGFFLIISFWFNHIYWMAFRDLLKILPVSSIAIQFSHFIFWQIDFLTIESFCQLLWPIDTFLKIYFLSNDGVIFSDYFGA